MREYSEKELLKSMEDLISKGFVVFVKWTCEKCLERATCDTPNAFYTQGFTHTKKSDGSICGHTSFPKKFGIVIMKGIVTGSKNDN